MTLLRDVVDAVPGIGADAVALLDMLLITCCRKLKKTGVIVTLHALKLGLTRMRCSVNEDTCYILPPPGAVNLMV